MAALASLGGNGAVLYNDHAGRSVCAGAESDVGGCGGDSDQEYPERGALEEGAAIYDDTGGARRWWGC